MILFLLHLAGAAALLLWAVRLIRTGVERAFIARLRLVLRRSESNRFLAALSGAGAALLLQSSMAVALIVAAFAVSGGLALPAGLVLVLGADLGSALAAKVLLLRVEWLAPLFLLIGVSLFLRGRVRAVRQAGRVFTGLALVFVSIDMIRAATAPLQDNYLVGQVVSYLDGDPFSSFLIGAVLAYAVHSSLAAVLIFVTFAASGVLSVPTGAALVLGANLGGAVIPYVLTLSMPVAARRVVVANLALRGGGAALALMALALLVPEHPFSGLTAQSQVLYVHIAFNFALLLIGMAVASPLAALLTRFMPDQASPAIDGRASALDEAALANPERALAAAGREVLRMGEKVAAMLAPALELYRTWNADTAAAIKRAEDEVDRMHFETKLFIARLQEGHLSSVQSRRAMDLATMANHLEDAADRISTNMLGMARRMKAEQLSFSKEGWSDLADFHDHISSNAQLALNVLMSGEAEVARQLLEEKDRIRHAEQLLQARHLDRLRNDTPESIETSNLHQETVRALKQVNTDLCWVATPIAEEAGDLLSSRLAGAGDETPPEEGSGNRKKKRRKQRQAQA